MRKFCSIVLLLSLCACVKQPNTQHHYAKKKQQPQAHISLFDYLFSNHGKSSSYKNQDSYTVNGKTYRTLKSSAGYREKGTATWYGKNFHNQRTSSGEHYNMYSMTAAHRTLPLNTFVKVTNLNNKRSVVVRINDRGPFHSSRLIDLSYAAARGIGLLPAGMALVEIQTTSPQAFHRSAPVALKKTSQHHTNHTTPAKNSLRKINKPTSKQNKKPVTRHVAHTQKQRPKRIHAIKKNQKHASNHNQQVKKHLVRERKAEVKKNKNPVLPKLQTRKKK